MKSYRKMCRGEKGFTLIELLIVVVILGILAAVAAVLITRFIGSGKLEAANEELHQAKLAVAAAMFDAGVSTLTDSDAVAGLGWDGSAGQIRAGAVAPGVDPADSISGAFKATYTFSASGDVTGAVVTVPVGRTGWTGIQWDATNKNWMKIP